MQGSRVTNSQALLEEQEKRKRTHGKSVGEPVAEWKSPASNHSQKRWQTHPGTVNDDGEHPVRGRQSMDQVFHRPREERAAPERAAFHSLGGKFQPCIISWGSCKIVTRREGPNRKELEEKCLSSGSHHGCARS